MNSANRKFFLSCFVQAAIDNLMPSQLGDLIFYTVVTGYCHCIFLRVCTCKDALVVEATQEGHGIYTTCQSLCHHFNPRATGSRLRQK